MSDEAKHTLFGGVPRSDEEHLRTQLAAVELLVARKDRDVQHHDILLATVFDLLQDGRQLTTQELDEGVHAAWPGLRMLSPQLEAALCAAEEIRHLRRVRATGAFDRWELLDAGRHELRESRSRATSLSERFREQVADELRANVGEARSEDLESIVAVVIAALRRSVARCFKSASDARVEHVGGWLRVPGTSVEEVTTFVEERIPDPKRSDLVQSLVLVALDPSQAFGSELVHHLVVGHLLYVFMARPDQAAAAAAAGTLKGELLVLDTPMLLRLCGPPSQAKPLLELLSAALGVGIDVAVFSRSVDELEHHLDTLETHEAAAIGDALAKGAPADLLASIERPIPGIRNWLLWAAGQPAGDRTWAAFRRMLRSSSGPVSALGAMGIRARPGAEYRDIADTMRFEGFKECLRDQVAREGVKRRHPSVIEHDAHTLMEVYRARTSNPSSGSKVWPGGFILTTDQQLDATYESAVSRQDFPVAITFSQFAQIVGAYSKPRAGEELAFAVADGLAEMEILTRSAAVPPDLAQQLAMAVAGEPTSAVGVEQLQLDLRRAWRAHRRELEEGTLDHERFIRDLTDQRRSRRQAASEQAAHVTKEEKRRADLVDARRDEQLRATEAQARSLAQTLSETQTSLAERDADWEAERQALKRGTRVTAGSAAGAVAAMSLAVAGHCIAAVVVALCAVIAWTFGREWARKSMSAPLAVLSAVGAITALVPPVRAWLER